MPSVVIIAGPNGAGKSTAAPFLLRDTLGLDEFVNADQIAAGHDRRASTVDDHVVWSRIIEIHKYMTTAKLPIVIPAKAGIQRRLWQRHWIPAFARMTNFCIVLRNAQ